MKSVKNTGCCSAAGPWSRGLLAVLVLTLVAACVVNPVTGEQELGWVDTGQEVAVGQQQYGPSQQMQGGAYALDPDLQAYVAGVGQRLAAVSDRALPYEFVVLNNSTPNAWALPGGKIAVNRGLLLELESEAELAAVLGHEITHAAARHGAKAMERGMLLQGALLVASLAMEDSEYADLALGGAQLGAALITQKYGRDAERQSDYYGMEYMRRAGYDPAAAITLQETFLELSGGAGGGGFGALFASHPPSAERVQNNRETLAGMGRLPDLEIGRDRYREATADLQRRAPAYAAYDAGRAALARGDIATASARAKEAVALEPREGRFHDLLGDVARARGDEGAALDAYQTARRLDPGYFEHHRDEGLALLQLDRRAEARAALERSVALLPTAQAANQLGQMALTEGDVDRARDWLSQAASADNRSGLEARISLARLDLARAPERFLSGEILIDERGRIGVEIVNRAPVATRDIIVQVLLRTPDGDIIGRRVEAPFIPAGRSVLRGTDLRIEEGMSRSDIETRVIAARPD